MPSTKFAHVVKEVRSARDMTLHEFGDALGVSHAAVALWEGGGDIADNRLSAWLNDDREWVRMMGFRIFIAKFGPTMAGVVANPLETSPNA